MPNDGILKSLFRGPEATAPEKRHKSGFDWLAEKEHEIKAETSPVNTAVHSVLDDEPTLETHAEAPAASSSWTETFKRFLPTVVVQRFFR